MTERRQTNGLKSLEEINYAFNEQFRSEQLRTTEKKPRFAFLRIMSDVLFYIAILVILYSVLSIDLSDGSRRNLVGFSHFIVMSSSMKDEIPKGSLIVIKETEPAALEVGDNITYVRDSSTTVTHKIIDIIDNEAGSADMSVEDAGAAIRFQTKGVNNASPDEYTVAGADVIGKVVLVLPGVGKVVNIISENIHIILIVFLICSLLSFITRGVSSFSRKSAAGRIRT